jgi:hypothetical protein
MFPVTDIIPYSLLSEMVGKEVTLALYKRMLVSKIITCY